MITTFRSDTATKREELDKISNAPVEFTATRCSSCGYALDQSIIHFLCKHSFHQRCVNPSGENVESQGIEGIECPICAPQNATIRAIKSSQDDNKKKHELFKDALQRSRDGFGTISEWFGRGVMNVSTTD